MSSYHQESFDIESSTAQKNMAINHELPKHEVPAEEINEYNVTLSKSGEVIPCGSNTSILVSIQKQGITVPFACSQGLCGTCRTKMLQGMVEMDAQGGLLKSHEKEGYILTCCSYPTTDVILEL
jgi:ferredoxin